MTTEALLIKLRTRSGDVVGWLTLPPFDQVPQAIAWGDRLFVADVNDEHTYREASVLVLGLRAS